MPNDMSGFPGKTVAEYIQQGILSPLAAFPAGAKGFWRDPADASTLFQDAAGTVPVTTLGDPVGRINDKSGNGYVWTQATAANRPTWNRDAAGYFYLNFDGTNDVLTSTTTVDFTGSDKVTYITAFESTNNTASRILTFNGYGTAGGWALYAVVGANAGPALPVSRASNGYRVWGGLSSNPSMQKQVLSARIDLALGASLVAAINARTNGRPAGPMSTGGSAPGTGNFASFTNSLGADTTPSSFFTGRYYGDMAVQGLLSDAILTGIENYYNSRIGAW